MSEDNDKSSPSQVAASAEDEGPDVRRVLRAGRVESDPPPDMLRGVQRKLRERSGGKFYADGWSTSKHPPIATYLVTSALMLAIALVVYALLSPLVGDPVPVRNEPAPVQVLPPQVTPPSER
jgi:hypothetical protein